MDALIRREKRDATKIFQIADNAIAKIKEDELNDPLKYAVDALEKIKPIAKRMDARTGKMDPSLRKSKAKRGRK